MCAEHWDQLSEDNEACEGRHEDLLGIETPLYAMAIQDDFRHWSLQQERYYVETITYTQAQDGAFPVTHRPKSTLAALPLRRFQR